MTDIARKGVAELVGTAILVFFAVGAAVFAIKNDTWDGNGTQALVPLGVIGVALAFGLTLMALAYAIGPISGCHVNPAVTLGVLINKGMTAKEAGVYWIAQFVGGIVGAALIKLVLSVGGVKDQTGGLGTNSWDGVTINAGGTFILEVILTFLLVFVVLLVTGKSAAPGFAGIAIGFTLVVVHFIGIPLDGTSVNPARSLGPALFNGGTPLSQIWLFILAPLVGGALAAVVQPLFKTPAPIPATRDTTGADLPRRTPPKKR